MRTAFAALLAFCLCLSGFCLSGCATGFKRAYVAGAVTTQFVDESQKIYDDEANARLAECDPEKNPESTVTTKGEFDECMGKVFSVESQDTIVKALAVYNAVAVAYSAVLLGCEPNEDGSPVSAATCVKKTFTSDQLRAWRGKLIEAAIEALGQFPEANAKIAKLKALVR